MTLRKRFNFVIVSGIICIIFITTFQGVGFSPKPTAVSAPMEGVIVLMLLDTDFDENEYNGAKNKLVSFGCTIVTTAPTENVESLGELEVTVDLLIGEVVVDDYDCIYIPGGSAPDNLITKPAVLSMIQEANSKSIALAAICSAPLVFAAADIVDGKNVTGSVTVQSELLAAGANYIGGSCVIDGNLITANYPYMDESCIAIVKVLGYFEEDPPEIGEFSYEVNYTDSKFSCSLEVEITDYFGVLTAKASAYKYENNGIDKNFITYVYLTDQDQDEVFTNTITDLEAGEYCIELYIQDLLWNEFLNETFLELNLQTTVNSAIGIITISGFTTIFLAIYFKRGKKQK
ncbi:MAG: DJ-1/PfpI family protein [Candidatus Heimdallarchaeota archaeon]